MVSIIFWFFIILILYVYIGYPSVVAIMSTLRPAPSVRKASIFPSVSVIIPAYNEGKVIGRTIQNALVAEYSHDKLEIIVTSDGSTDDTNEIVETFACHGVKLITSHSSSGKSLAQNRAVNEARGDILIFSDADVLLRPDAITNMCRAFADETVGCVIGKITYLNGTDASVSEGESAYWRYERFLRRKESEIGNFAMGSGFMAIRRRLFRPLDQNVGDDFVLPMQTAMAGYRVIYEPAAISQTVLPNDPANMLNSKIRVISKDLRGLVMCRSILNPFKYPLYAWGLISHKLLRWLVPYFMIVLFALNLLLLGRPLFHLLLALQIAFYALAAIGLFLQKKGKRPHIFGAPFFFCLVNLAALVGVAQFMTGKTAGRWEPIR